MNRVPIVLAISASDHMRGIADGSAPVVGVELTVLELPAPEIFARFVPHREWHVSELSLAKYVALRAAGDDSLTAIPVFPSRSWRHSALYALPDGPASPAQLAGARIGLPEWAQTAAVYTRALLQYEWDIDPRLIAWTQAGLDVPGREEKLAVSPPDGISLQRVADRSLSELLAERQIDAILSAHPPAAAQGPGAHVRQLTSTQEQERDYLARTGIFPIMHVVVIRSDTADEHPWLAANLFTAFEESKQQSLRRIGDFAVSRYPLPWLGYHLESARAAVGPDPWPYGIDANRVTLEAFVGFCVEQGIASWPIPVDELFAPEVREPVRL